MSKETTTTIKTVSHKTFIYGNGQLSICLKFKDNINVLYDNALIINNMVNKHLIDIE